MSERLTWKEIQEKYPDQWVVMDDVNLDGSTILSGVVVEVCTDDEIDSYYCKAIKSGDEETLFTCMFDTGADTPVWCARPEILQFLYPSSYKADGVFLLGGFGKGVSKTDMYIIPEFTRGNYDVWEIIVEGNSGKESRPVGSVRRCKIYER